jgi:hypothetical protein
MGHRERPRCPEMGSRMAHRAPDDLDSIPGASTSSATFRLLILGTPYRGSQPFASVWRRFRTECHEVEDSHSDPSSFRGAGQSRRTSGASSRPPRGAASARGPETGSARGRPTPGGRRCGTRRSGPCRSSAAESMGLPTKRPRGVSSLSFRTARAAPLDAEGVVPREVPARGRHHVLRHGLQGERPLPGRAGRHRAARSVTRSSSSCPNVSRSPSPKPMPSSVASFDGWSSCRTSSVLPPFSSKVTVVTA